MNRINEKRLNFRIDAEAPGSSARACTFTTLHNKVETPVFMPVATLAVLRDQATTTVESMGFPVLLANTYHLIIRPGTDVFAKFGGIHPFMDWPRSVLTDSGGFQIYSLPGAVKISEEGASFRSYHDGRLIMLTPEKSIEAQKIINSDIMMALDQCVPSTSEKSVCIKAMDRTARWAERSLRARGESGQSVFGIVQGACYSELRKTSAAQISSLPFDGYAIGGLAVGETSSERIEMTGLTASLLPKDYPRYLMGVGTPIDLLEAVNCGVDMFDCIIPTSLAQQGVAYTSHGRIELRRGIHKFSEMPLDENCTCPACRKYSRAYLHHLVKTGEFYGSSLVGTHNLFFYKNLMSKMRDHILSGSFSSFYNEQKEILAARDIHNPVRPPKKSSRKSLPSSGDYEVIMQDGGSFSIRNNSSGIKTDCGSEPAAAALSVYAGQTDLPGLAREQDKSPVIIWDVELGCGINAMTAIREYEKLCRQGHTGRGLRIVSFEHDMNTFSLASSSPEFFRHMRHAAPSALLKKGHWISADYPVRWELAAGDFLKTMHHAPLPDLIYCNTFYSTENSPEWDFSLFCKLYELVSEKNTAIFTCSSSLMTRASMLAAGFFTGPGVPSGTLNETTAAFTKQDRGNIKLFENEWLDEFLKKFDAQFSLSGDIEISLIRKLVAGHIQFTSDQSFQK